MAISQEWQGPMPAPDILREYEAIVPGAAERIIRMAEADSTERAQVDHDLARAEIGRAKTGQMLAMLLVLGAMAMSAVFFFRDNNVAGSAFIGVPLLVLIGAFLRPSAKKE